MSHRGRIAVHITLAFAGALVFGGCLADPPRARQDGDGGPEPGTGGNQGSGGETHTGGASSGGANSGGATTTGGVSGQTGGAAGSPVDAAVDDPSDGAVEGSVQPEGGGCLGSSCVPVCTQANNSCPDPTTLRACNTQGTGFVDSTCSAGCVTGPPAHCGALVPAGGAVTSSDLTNATVKAISLPAGVTVFNTDSGSISGGITRDPNVVTNTLEVSADGIGFHSAPDGTGVFVFQALTIPAGATLKVVGTAPVAIVAGQNLLVYGVVDVRPMDTSGALCAIGSAGPGGSAGGLAGIPGPTPASGTKGTGLGGGGGGTLLLQGNPGGGGGAGRVAAGGIGGPGCRMSAINAGGGSGGATYGGTNGGSGGGGGGNRQGFGGGSGGAIRLVAGKVLTIGDGTNVAGVNAGGCGGKAAEFGIGAGGGGSGGSIWLEAPLVQLRAKATLAANGGGGGGSTEGQAGQLSNLRSLGSGSSQVSPLADGGAGNVPTGGSPPGTCGTFEGYGGGGSAGPIRILSGGGTPSVNGQAVLSPSVSSGGATYGASTIN